ncbi:hypothetical protein ACTJKF_19940 [Burkholderia sp. 22313]
MENLLFKPKALKSRFWRRRKHSFIAGRLRAGFRRPKTKLEGRVEIRPDFLSFFVISDRPGAPVD